MNGLINISSVDLMTVDEVREIHKKISSEGKSLFDWYIEVIAQKGFVYTYRYDPFDYLVDIRLDKDGAAICRKITHDMYRDEDVRMIEVAKMLRKLDDFLKGENNV